MATFIKQVYRRRRHLRVRAKIFGSDQRPRVAVFRSAKHIYGQAIDDNARTTIASVSDLHLKGKNKTKRAFQVGELLGEKLKKNKVESVLFDRGGFKYHGRVKALADGLRKSGLKF